VHTIAETKVDTYYWNLQSCQTYSPASIIEEKALDINYTRH